MVIFRWGQRRRRAQQLVEGALALKASPKLPAGISATGRVYKVNVGHRTLVYLANLFVLIVAENEHEAVELLLKWADGDSQMRALVRGGEFILQEVSPTEKGVY